jgi:PAS domain S-box-containing protein
MEKSKVTNLKLAQNFISKQLLTIATEFSVKINDLIWDERASDNNSSVHHIAVNFSGFRSVISFGNSELLNEYGTKEWEETIKDKLKIFLTDSENKVKQKWEIENKQISQLGIIPEDIELKTKDELIQDFEKMHQEFAELYATETEVEEELKNTEDRFKTLVENAPIGIYYSDLYGKFLHGNKKAEELSGYKREELIGKNYFRVNLLGTKDLVKAFRLLGLNMLGTATGPDELTLKRKDGSLRTVEISTQLVKLEGKRVVMGMVQDITKRKQIEERFQLATKAATVGVWEWNIQTGDFYLCPNVKAILGYSDEEIPNDLDTWANYIHPEDKQQTMELAQEHLDGKTLEYKCEHRMIHKDGSIRWMLTRGKAIRDAKGKAIRMVGTDMDITEKKHAEVEREKLIGELQEALGQVKKLSGLLPICSVCKKVRDDKGYWHQVETYVTAHSEANFSHGICPDCAGKYYSELNNNKEGKSTT